MSRVRAVVANGLEAQVPVMIQRMGVFYTEVTMQCVLLDAAATVSERTPSQWEAAMCTEMHSANVAYHRKTDGAEEYVHRMQTVAAMALTAAMEMDARTQKPPQPAECQCDACKSGDPVTRLDQLIRLLRSVPRPPGQPG